MEPRIFHGNFSPSDFARTLLGEFNHGNRRAQQIGSNQEVIVQIASSDQPSAGGATALTITLRTVEDGVAIQIGKQSETPGTCWDGSMMSPRISRICN
jgi:hypothetical protein